MVHSDPISLLLSAHAQFRNILIGCRLYEKRRFCEKGKKQPV